MPRRTKDDWTAIALDAIARGGVAAVAVEPLAAAAGATKGSLYWHFPTRDALLEAALARWEREFTERVIHLADQGATPEQRLRLLFAAVLDGDRHADVEVALLAGTADPIVAAAVTRVTERRIAYLAAQFADMGFDRSAAKRRARIAYSVYVGQAQLTHAVPGLMPRSSASRRAHLADLLRTMLVEPGQG